jgi:cardiolipin synthase A/B
MDEASPNSANCPQMEGHARAGINVRPGADDDGWTALPPVTLADGTRITLFKDGEALHAGLEAIRGARRRICVEIYIFKNDATGKAFADLLSERARAGVRCYLIYDSFGSIGSRSLIDQMRQAGVRIAEFHPVAPWRCRFGWRPGNRDHRKLLIVDDQIAGLGGLNIADEYAGQWVAGNRAKTEWLMRDNAIGLIGPGVTALLASFSRTWSYVQTGGRIWKTEYRHQLNIRSDRKGRRIGKSRLGGLTPCEVLMGDFGVLASAPTLNSPLRPMLYELLHTARKRISIIMAYFAPDDELVKQLCDAAQRGCRVRIVLASRSDLHVMVIAARSFYSRLLEAGVEIYERRGAVLHAKTLVVDDVAIVGSTNLDYRSIEFNLELSALLKSQGFSDEVDQLVDHDVKFSNRINRYHWRRRPRLDRLTQWAVSRFRYLL